MAQNVTTDDLQKALSALADKMGISVKEYVEAGFVDITAYGQDKAAIIKRLDAIDVVSSKDNVTSLAEKITSINKVLAADGGALQGVIDLTKENGTKIEAVNTLVAGLTSKLGTQGTKLDANAADIASVKGIIADQKTKQDATNVATTKSIGDNKANISILKGGADVEGSVAKMVADEATRTNIEITNSKTDLQAKIDKINAGADVKGSVESKIASAVTAVTAKIPDLAPMTARIAEGEVKAAALASIVEDTTDAAGKLVKGVATKTQENVTAIAKETEDRIASIEATLAEAKKYTDAQQVMASSIDLTVISNAFRGALGLIEKQVAATTGDGATL